MYGLLDTFYFEMADIPPGSVPEGLAERSLLNLVGVLFSPVLCQVKSTLVKYISGTSAKRDWNQSCYPVLGCFYYQENMSLPMGPPVSPEKLDTTFYFFDNKSAEDLEDLLGKGKNITRPERTWTLRNLSYSNMTDRLKTDRPLMVLTHGFRGSKRARWMLPLVKALLTNLTCTALVVDWQKGANGSYRDSAVNSPMVGVLISLFLQKIITETACAITPDNITLIGFSLGAHIMGFAGRHFLNATGMLLGRISGLDPAGYLFDNETLGLSKNDAKYVDVIHTNGGDLEDLKLGLIKQIGHVDFYPNNGSWQPGCEEYPSLGDFTNSLACSHYRSAFLYAESLTNHNCSFTSYNCTDWEEYLNGTCQNETKQEGIGLLGYYSFTAPGRGRQYLATNDEPPYCRRNTTPPIRKPTQSSFLSILKQCKNSNPSF